MPAIVGIAQVLNMGSGGVFHIGDVLRIAPRSTTKTFAGAGSFNTAERLYVYNYKSFTNTNDKDIVDQANTLNV